MKQEWYLNKNYSVWILLAMSTYQVWNKSITRKFKGIMVLMIQYWVFAEYWWGCATCLDFKVSVSYCVKIVTTTIYITFVTFGDNDWYIGVSWLNIHTNIYTKWEISPRFLSMEFHAHMVFKQIDDCLLWQWDTIAKVVRLIMLGYKCYFYFILFTWSFLFLLTRLLCLSVNSTQRHSVV